MIRNSLLAMATGLAMTLVGAAAAPAADIKILSANILRGVLLEIGPQFEQATGHKIDATFGPPGQIRATLLGGGAAEQVKTKSILNDSSLSTEIVARGMEPAK